MKVISQWFLWVYLLPASAELGIGGSRAVHAQCYVSGNAEFGNAFSERGGCLLQKKRGLLRVLWAFMGRGGLVPACPTYGGVLAGTRTVGAVPPAQKLGRWFGGWGWLLGRIKGGSSLCIRPTNSPGASACRGKLRHNHTHWRRRAAGTGPASSISRSALFA